MSEEAKQLKAALWYQGRGYSVIPLNQNKKPYLREWKPYQTKRAWQDQIREWWKRWPTANIGIVTGKISGLIIVDVDSEDGLDALNEFLPDSLLTPIAKTPDGGWHYYFEYKPGLINRARVIEGTDIRTDGDYGIASPSCCKYEKNGRKIEGNHTWMNGLSIAK
jgi:hypothetical protein